MVWWPLLASAGLSLIDNLTNKPKQTAPAEDLNKERSDALYQLLTGAGNMNPQSWMDQSQALQGQLQGLFGQLATGATIPGDFNQASSLADQALSEFGTSYRDLARQQSQDAVRQMEASMGKGGLFSTAGGSVASALQQGALRPLLEAETTLAGKKADTSQNLFSQLLGSRHSALGSGINLNSNQQQMANALLGLLGQQSEQAWQPAQYNENGGTDLAGDLAPLLAAFIK